MLNTGVGYSASASYLLLLSFVTSCALHNLESFFILLVVAKKQWDIYLSRYLIKNACTICE